MKHLTKPMLGTQLNWAHPLNKGLAGFWLFNEGNGDKIQDLSMNGNTGTLTNMAFPSTPASGWNPGRKGVGLNFDGSNDYVDAGNINGFAANGITLEAWVKNSKTSFSAITYQAESIAGASTGDNWTTYRRGRLGVDTPGGTLVDYVIPNTDFGGQTVVIYGYQTDTSVYAGTWLIKDETTGETLGSGSLSKKAIGDADKRMNSPFVFEGQGHDYHVYVYFSNTTDVFIDRVAFSKGAYDGIITQDERIELVQYVNQYRVYVNGVSKVVAGSAISNTWQHLVVTYDNANVKLYVDSVLVGTAAYVSSISDSANHFLIGEYSSSHYNFWGSIDEVRIYNRALSAQEIMQLYIDPYCMFKMPSYAREFAMA